MRSMHRELDPEFTAVSERGFRTPVANIARVTAILEHSNNPNLRQALRYTQRAWIQLDQQNSVSTVREEHVGKTRSQAHSRTAGGCPRPHRSSNNDNTRRSQALAGDSSCRCFTGCPPRGILKVVSLGEEMPRSGTRKCKEHKI
jgi:hypothetical protein